MEVILEEDPVPIVMIVGQKIRKALSEPNTLMAVKGLKGAFGLVSTRDPQALTVTLTGTQIHLQRGIGGSNLINIHLDFNSDEKPTIEGLWKHPLFASKIAKLLEPPVTDWKVAANRFWLKLENASHSPAGLQITETGSQETLHLGAQPADLEIEGSARNLSDIFDGGKVFLEAAMKGEIKVKGRLPHATVLTRQSIMNLLGEDQ